MTTLFETTDVEAAHQMLVATYGAMRVTVTGERHRARVARRTVGPIELHHNTFTMRFHVDADPSHRVTMGRVLGGSFSYRGGADQSDNETGDIFLIAHPDSPYQSMNVDVDLEFAVIDPALLALVADTDAGRGAEPFRFTGTHPVSAQAMRLWSTTYDFVRDNIAGTPAAHKPLLAGNATRLLLATALATFPSNVSHDPTVGDRRDAHPATLRRAVAFIDDNAHRDISPADVAGASHVTIRTLQLAFRRHLDTTPGAYLRRARLERAHRDLLDGDPASTTVGAVAARWGFASHSRFTAHYHAVYGQLPSDTLRDL
ncbi:helix-turn-helix transcriptional regulator [Dactylosporangium sp. NPDC049140]|uniref:helix-turn-helix transcriptional regulator n=1 Tax=Dactylosporangium sp. NPDC049140 TaxID=3155647 RepID=UPI0033FD4DD2